MNQSKVYIVQEQPTLNYADAQRFGELIFVCQYDYSLARNSRCNDVIRDNIQTILKDYNHERDYLLLVGDPVLIGLVMSYALDMGEVNILKWERSGKRYAAITGIKKPG